ncbi:signal recognition particle 9 kDa protein-domain-containing protein [Massariosphaeria phaeospora]|uniref:Signal recognition particle 9 kDa protein-domain-containing protein n=1 Tax=Massariosphaeria phaeospora TaxID=100035 RepID=A0A7C8I995_9PLEO|nr:signal recognition particle 9 kDa protein-domain-containing protein [Massariosphaeria phaeospora]
MPTFKTSTEWYEQSSLLLKAYPSTTRITSKYRVQKPTPSKIKKRERYAAKQADKPKPEAASEAPDSTTPAADELTASFTLKTYEPASGACLKYETNKAAEVGRLIGNLSRLGRHMAAIPGATEDLSAPAEPMDISTPIGEGDVKMVDAAATDKASGGGGGGGKKKKKGKK